MSDGTHIGANPSAPSLQHDQIAPAVDSVALTERHQAIQGANRPKPFDELIQGAIDFESQFDAYQLDKKPRFDQQTLRIGSTVLEVDKESFGELCNTMSIPSQYAIALPEPFRSELINHHLENEDYRRNRFCGNDPSVMSRRGRFVGFVRTDLLQLTLRDALEAFQEGIGVDSENLLVQKAEFGERSCKFEFVRRDVATEVRAGDVIHGGYLIRYSPTGSHATQISTYVLRLVCKNGMTRKDCVSQASISRTRRQRRDNPDARLLELGQIHQRSAAVSAGLIDALAGVVGLADQEVNVEQLLEQSLRRARLWSRNTMALLLSALRAEEDYQGTAYAAMNALTYAATHNVSELSIRQRQGLSALGGLLAHRENHVCPRCYSVISS